MNYKNISKCPFRILSITLMLILITGCGQNAVSGQNNNESNDSHDDHSNAGDDAHAHGDVGELDPIVVTYFTDKVQLFMEYPHLVQGKRARFLAHVTVLETGEPVKSGQVELILSQPDGTEISILASEPERDGLFIPAKTFDKPGTYKGRIIVTSPQVEDSFEFGIVAIHSNDHEAQSAAEFLATDAPTDAIVFLLEQQWQINFLLAQAESQTLVKRLLVPGLIAPASGHAAVVSSPISGRLVSPTNGALPKIGDMVKAGQLLGFIEPPLPVTDAMQLAANKASIQAMETELLIKELDLNFKGLEVEQAISQAQTRLEFAQQAFTRIAPLHEQGLRTAQQYAEVERTLKLAETELSGALSLKVSFDQAVATLEKLRMQYISGSTQNSSESYFYLPIKAPITGTVVSVGQIEGEHIDSTDEIYRIINAETIWVVAQVPEFDLHEINDAPEAVISLPSFPNERFDISQLGGKLINTSIALDESSRTLALIYEMPNHQGRFRIGQFVDVKLGTMVSVNTVSIPESAIIPDSGRPTVYVLINGEIFQRREVVLGIRDGGYVEIINGINEGDWVVAVGGNAVRLAALSPAAFGHGHAH